MITSRRSLITGLIAFIGAPAIVRAGSLMPVKALKPEPDFYKITGTMYNFNKDGIEHVYLESTDGISWYQYRFPNLIPYETAVKT